MFRACQRNLGWRSELADLAGTVAPVPPPLPKCCFMCQCVQKVNASMSLTGDIGPEDCFTCCNYTVELFYPSFAEVKLYFSTRLQIWGLFHLFTYLSNLSSLMLEGKKSETKRESWQVLKLKSYWLSHLTCSFIPVFYSRKQMFNLVWIKGFILW